MITWKFKATIRKTGNSHAIIIPSHLIKAGIFKCDDKVNIRITKGGDNNEI